MLLGSPPDMVHSLTLRKTHPSTQRNDGAGYTGAALGSGIDPCYSGFQVQGTATAPTGMTPSDTPKQSFLRLLLVYHIIFKIASNFSNFLNI